MKLSYVSLLSIPILSSTKVELLTELQRYLQEKKSFTLFTPNPEILVRAYKDKEFAQILRQNELNIPDGVGISFFTGISTIKGRTFVIDILKILNEQKGSCYLVGATDEVIQKSMETIQHEFPDVEVSGRVGPQLDNTAHPVSSENIQLQQQIETELTSKPPVIVFVAFGAPKQEFWIASMKEKFPSISFMAVGGSLDTYSGVKSVPPHLMERVHLEWLFRLIQEPYRFMRIMNAIFVFPLLVVFNSIKPVSQEQ